MPRRLNTIIIVPHSKAKFIKLSFSSRSLIVAGVSVAIAIVLSAIAIGFTGSAVGRRAEVARLQAENAELADVNTRLEQTISDVQGRLDEFEERAARLALAAGMGPDAAPVGGGSGGGERVGSGGPYDRMPETPEVLVLQGDRIAQQLESVQQALDRQDETLASTPTVAPAMGVITDGFGRRSDPFTGRQAFHTGLDISARRGTSIAAPADGVVVFAGRNGGLGKSVRVSHGFGITTVYGHLDTINVAPGDEIHRGDKLGTLGNTGRSTGPHLHYEVHVDGKAVNPLYYILDAF